MGKKKTLGGEESADGFGGLDHQANAAAMTAQGFFQSPPPMPGFPPGGAPPPPPTLGYPAAPPPPTLGCPAAPPPPTLGFPGAPPPPTLGFPGMQTAPLLSAQCSAPPGAQCAAPPTPLIGAPGLPPGFPHATMQMQMPGFPGQLSAEALQHLRAQAGVMPQFAGNLIQMQASAAQSAQDNIPAAFRKKLSPPDPSMLSPGQGATHPGMVPTAMTSPAMGNTVVAVNPVAMMANPLGNPAAMPAANPLGAPSAANMAANPLLAIAMQQQQMMSMQQQQIDPTAALLANPAAAALVDPMVAMAARSGSAIAQQMLRNALQNAMNPGAAPAPVKPEPVAAPQSSAPDPDVVELFDHFNIDPRHMERFLGLMERRKDTFEGDMLKLWELCEQARSPEGMFVSKMREMEKGIFIGKTVPDKELQEMSKKFKLDSEAESKLSDVLAKYPPDERREKMQELSRHLETSSRPSAMVMMSLKKLGENLPLGRPGPSAPGCYLDKLKKGEVDERGDDRREKARDRGGDRDRDSGRKKDGWNPRENSRDRGKGRDKSRDRRRSRDRSRGRSRS